MPDFDDVGFVLLAGGKGSRMKANVPKQFLSLCNVPILHHSLDLFLERLPAYATENGKRYVNDSKRVAEFSCRLTPRSFQVALHLSFS